MNSQFWDDFGKPIEQKWPPVEKLGQLSGP